MRLIDADLLKIALYYDVSKGTYGEFMDGSEVSYTNKEILKLIDDQPTIEAVPVIRCIDCKHNVANKKIHPLDITDYSGEDIVCDYFMTDGLNSKDYCSYAERKEE